MNARSLLMVAGAVSPIALALTPAGLFLFLAAVTALTSAAVIRQRQRSTAPEPAGVEASRD